METDRAPSSSEASLAAVAEAFHLPRFDGEALYVGMVGSAEPLAAYPARIPFTSTLCRQVHFSLDQYRYWVKAMKDKPLFHRKQWEFVYVAQALFERRMLAPGRRGLAFGVGKEPLPALFASLGCEVVATDQSLDGAVRAGWVRTNEHSSDLSALNERGICPPDLFAARVSFEEADMNAIPTKFNGGFDFCWSACSLEHLGSLRRGIDFVLNSMRVLKPGGVAVHTTEFNLSSNDETIETQDLSIYRRRDIESLIEELTRQGFVVEPLDLSPNDGFAERVIDLPPFSRGEPHIRLQIGNFDCTSVGIIATAA